MKQILKIIFLSLGILVVSGYFVFAATSFSTIDRERKCETVDIRFSDEDENMLVTKAEVESILKLKGLHPLGKMYSDIQIDSIESVLRANAMLKSVECYSLPSGKLILQITQRKPAFMVVANESYYIDNERVSIPVSENYNAELPVVTGSVSRKSASGKMYDFVKYISADEFWLAQIEQIFVRTDGKVEIVTKMGDAVVLLGSLDGYEKKLDKLFALYKDVFSVKGWNRYAYINLEYKNQVVCNQLTNNN